MKKVYLLGGLGNNLFQIEKGLEDDEEVVFITNIIASRRINHCFGWTYHGPDVINMMFKQNVIFKQLSWIFVLQHLSQLVVAKTLNIQFLGVSWENKILTKVNFGYFQFHRKSLPSLKLAMDSSSVDFGDTALPLVHVRLGDSPNLEQDIAAQLQLLLTLKYPKFRVVTNKPSEFLSRVKQVPLTFIVVGGDVIQDFHILSRAQIVIIPQSTFSLFASLTNQQLKHLYLRESARNLFDIDLCHIKYTIY